MVITLVRKQPLCRLPFLGIALILFFQVSCLPFANRMRATRFYRETECTPAEFISQTRQRLSDQQIGTTDPTTEGKGLAISTDVFVERIGKRERMGKYQLIVQPLEYTNRFAVTLQRVEGKSKGIRERRWYDDDVTASAPESKQQLWQQVKAICPSP